MAHSVFLDFYMYLESRKGQKLTNSNFSENFLFERKSQKVAQIGYFGF